ncbi:MAG: GDSL-type esterase/lipase family protein [Acholeplasmataceae bacterium]
MINTSEIWEREVFEIEEKKERKEHIDIVFYGSSSIRLWSTLKDDFISYSVLNHGFGGSKINDAIYYYDRLVKPFNPRAVVLFSGVNDLDYIAKSLHSGRRVFNHFKKFYKKHMQTLGVPLVYILMTPCIAKWAYIKEMKEANNLIKNFAEKHQNLYILDVTDKFLEDGYPIEELFVGDGLHLSKDGYEIWKNALLPLINDIL